MSKRTKVHNTIEECFMYACFALAIVAASVTAIVLRMDGIESTQNWSIAGVGLATSGVWASLGIFLYQDRKREKADLKHRDADECIKKQLSAILERLEKCDCRCQAECRSYVVAQADQRRSWLFGLLCSSARG